MRYQNPQILYFLFAIAIPVIIHLFNLQKHKLVYFSNIQLLKEIQSKKKKRNTLKQLLILLSRILAIISIVLAFSNPYIPNNKDNLISQDTFIYIDNSFSMDNISEKGRLLEIAKEQAMQIINSTNQTNNFWIITNDFTSAENLPKSKDQAEKYIFSIESSPIIRNKEEVINKKESLSKKESNIFLISDFQKQSTDITFLNALDSNNNIVLIPLNKQPNSNISIDSCWTENPINNMSTQNTVKVKLHNYGEKDISDIIVKLQINNLHKTQQNVSLNANESKEIELFFTNDSKKLNNGIISIEDHPITFDNKLYFSFKIDDQINVCQVYEDEENRNINKIFKSEEDMQYSSWNINQLNYEELKNQKLIIINEVNEFSSGFTNTIYNYIQKGGNLCIVPKKQANIDHYNSFLESINTDLINKDHNNTIKVSKLNQKHAIFNNVFKTKNLRKDINLPSVNYYYTLQNKNNTIKQNILTTETGDPFLNHYKIGKGEVYLFTSPLSEENNNFTKHALFVTTLFNMAINSIKSEQLYYTIFNNQEIKLPKTLQSKENIFHLKSKEIDVITDFISESNSRYLLTHNQINQATHYDLLQEDELLNTIAFNYSREESNIDQYTSNEISEFISLNNLENIFMFNINESIKKNIKKINNQKEYWKLCIILALLFIGIEIALIKIIQP